ncbi:MAG: hypothetical protein JNJ48_08820 [Phycisphaerae bacterium]|nr:hypothetical protein [Phycisphaerae bacterium]
MITLATNGPIASPWVAVPVVSVAMLLVAAHVLAIQRVPMPSSRRRIRTANGLLMLVALPLLAYAVSVVPPADKRPFVLAWMSVMILVSMVLGLALVDIANNIRLFARARAELDRMAARGLAGKVRAASGTPGAGSEGSVRDER